jgi:hypothetical protein
MKSIQNLAPSLNSGESCSFGYTTISNRVVDRLSSAMREVAKNQRGDDHAPSKLILNREEHRVLV